MDDSAWVRYSNPKRDVTKRGRAEVRSVNKRTICEHCGKNALNIMYHYEHVHPEFWQRWYAKPSPSISSGSIGTISGVRIFRT